MSDCHKYPKTNKIEGKKMDNEETKALIESKDIKHLKILDLALTGMSHRQISLQLGYSLSTVKRAIYSDEGQTVLKQAVARMNHEIAKALPSMVKLACEQLTSLIIMSDRSQTRLASAKQIMAIWSKLQRISE